MIINIKTFSGCSGLSTIMIGNGINKISNYAFANCVKLSDVYCYAENVPGTDIDAFNDSYIEYATLHVPVSSVDAYKAAEPWSGFKSKVKIAAKVKLSKSETTIEKGKTVTLKATITPSTLLDKCVTWKSSNTKVATVTSKGKVKGIKAGTATITCTSVATGLKGTCTVTVLATSESRSTDGNDDNVTGIKELEENSVATEPYDVYDLSGRKVLNQTNTLDGLPAGVYIVNGHKVLKK